MTFEEKFNEYLVEIVNNSYTESGYYYIIGINYTDGMKLKLL